MKNKIYLYLWFAITIFPFNLFKVESTISNLVSNRTYAPEWVHVIIHLFLYSILVFLIINAFNPKYDQLSTLIIIAVILVAGGLQESLQLIEKNRFFNWNDLFDIGVDIAAGMLSWILVQNIRRKQVLS